MPNEAAPNEEAELAGWPDPQSAQRWVRLRALAHRGTTEGLGRLTDLEADSLFRGVSDCVEALRSARAALDHGRRSQFMVDLRDVVFFRYLAVRIQAGHLPPEEKARCAELLVDLVWQVFGKEPA